MVVQIGTHLSDASPIQNFLKQDGVLLPRIFGFTLQYATGEAQGNVEKLELNETHLLLVYHNNISLLSENINTTKKNTTPCGNLPHMLSKC
jgi:hypothetical protein